MDLDDKTDILLEIVEVFVNQILYARDLYPEQIFKTKRIYNWPVKAVVYPPLNSYIKEVLSAAKAILSTNELDMIEMYFYSTEGRIIETYKFDIKNISANVNDGRSADQFHIEMEETIRLNLGKLSERLNFLPKLDKNVEFKILLHTNESAFVQMSHKPQYQEFPWLRDDELSGNLASSTSILPLVQMKNFCLRINAELF